MWRKRSATTWPSHSAWARNWRERHRGAPGRRRIHHHHERAAQHRHGDRCGAKDPQRPGPAIPPGRGTGESDTVARLGGDEFTITMSELHNIDTVTDVAQKIRNDLAQPFRLGEELA